MLPPKLKSVLLDVVAMVNFVKSSPLNTSTEILRLICQQLNIEVETLLLHTELRWLSNGKVIARVATLKTEMKKFLFEIQHTNQNDSNSNSLIRNGR